MKKLIFSFVLAIGVFMTNSFANSSNLSKAKPTITIRTKANSRADCAARCSMEAQTPAGDSILWEILYMICMQQCMNER